MPRDSIALRGMGKLTVGGNTFERHLSVFINALTINREFNNSMSNVINYRKILLSSVVIAFVASMVFAGTNAFFNDTETSTGNTFTAGAIDLKIDSEQHYNGNVCEDVGTSTPNYQWVGNSAYPVPGSSCDGSWELTDLESGVHKFFNFDDVKPGDEGENTISIHIDNNEAWMCADIDVTKNDDVDCTEPEDDAEGAGVCENSLPSAEFDGELAQNLDIFTWLDDGVTPGFQGDDEGEGDNIWQANELSLFSNGVGPLSDAIGGVSYALADSDTGNGPLPAGATQYIGLTWCAGTLTIDAPGDLTCDGATMGNDAQTDEVMLDMTFRVEQYRNNPNFLCEPEIVEPPAATSTLTLVKEVVLVASSTSTSTPADWTLSAVGLVDSISGITGTAAVTDQVVEVGDYDLSESAIAGFTLTDLSCIGGGSLATSTLTLAAGEDVTCTFTNSELQI